MASVGGNRLHQGAQIKVLRRPGILLLRPARSSVGSFQPGVYRFFGAEDAQGFPRAFCTLP